MRCALQLPATGEETASDVPALCVGLLFALPFVRELMPDVPTVGIATDMLDFFWNMMLLAISTIMTFIALLQKHRHRSHLERSSSIKVQDSGSGKQPVDTCAACSAAPRVLVTTLQGDDGSKGQRQEE